MGSAASEHLLKGFPQLETLHPTPARVTMAVGPPAVGAGAQAKGKLFEAEVPDVLGSSPAFRAAKEQPATSTSAAKKVHPSRRGRVVDALAQVGQWNWSSMWWACWISLTMIPWRWKTAAASTRIAALTRKARFSAITESTRL